MSNIAFTKVESTPSDEWSHSVSAYNLSAPWQVVLQVVLCDQACRLGGTEILNNPLPLPLSLEFCCPWFCNSAKSKPVGEGSSPHSYVCAMLTASKFELTSYIKLIKIIGKLLGLLSQNLNAKSKE